MQFGSHESLEDFAARMNRDANRPMTLVEKLRFPQRVEGGALDSPVAERVMAEAADRIERIADLEATVASMRDTLIGAEVVIRLLAPTGQETTLQTIRRAIERAEK